MTERWIPLGAEREALRRLLDQASTDLPHVADAMWGGARALLALREVMDEMGYVAVVRDREEAVVLAGDERLIPVASEDETRLHLADLHRPDMLGPRVSAPDAALCLASPLPTLRLPGDGDVITGCIRRPGHPREAGHEAIRVKRGSVPGYVRVCWHEALS